MSHHLTSEHPVSPPPGRHARSRARFLPGADAFRLRPRPGVPREVQASFVLWLTALAAGVVETILGVVNVLATGAATAGVTSLVAFRVVITAMLVYVVVQLRLGRPLARASLAVLLGVVGLLSLVLDPISALAGGESLGAVLGDMGPEGPLAGLFAPVRLVHILSVVAALVLMFRPAANRYFRDAPWP